MELGIFEAALTSCCSYLQFEILKTGNAEFCVCVELTWWPLLLCLKIMLVTTLWIRDLFLPFFLLFILLVAVLLTYFSATFDIFRAEFASSHKASNAF